MTDDEIIAHVRENFFEPARALRQEPMDKPLTECFLNLFMFPAPAAEAAWGEALTDGTFEARVMEKRALTFERPTSPAVKLFILLLCQSPADLVMYLSYAYWRTADGGRVALDMSGLAEIFPCGFWREADRRELWDAQKLPFPLDNALDCRAVVDWCNRGGRP